MKYFMRPGEWRIDRKYFTKKGLMGLGLTEEEGLCELGQREAAPSFLAKS